MAEYELVAGTVDTHGGGHVDNAVFPRYVAIARERFLRDTVPRFEAYRRPVVHLEVDYHAELFPGDDVTAEVGVRDVGTTSLTTEVALSTAAERVATAETVQVLVDPETGESKRVPEDWRAALS